MRTLHLLLLSGGLQTVAEVEAQRPPILWSHTYGGSNADWIGDVEPCADGGYIVAGRTISNDGDVSGNHDPLGHVPDVWLLKLDSSGVLQWQQCYGGAHIDFPFRVVQMPDSGFLVVGATVSNSGDVSGWHGDVDGWVFRTDAAGVVVWQRCLGGSAEDELWDVVVMPDGGAVLLGSTKSNDGDVSGLHGTVDDAWLVRLDANGTLLWQRCLGNTDNDYGRAMVAGPNGTFTILADRYSSPNCPWGSYELWLFNVDSLGTSAWSTCLGGSGFDYGRALANTMDGGYLVGGATGSIDHDAVGNHDTTGNFNDAFLARVDSNGDPLWTGVFGGSQHDAFEHVLELPDGSVRALGWTNSADGNVTGPLGSRDLWLAELTAGGTLSAAWCYGGSGTDEGFDAELLADGSLVIGADCGSQNGDVQGTSGWIDHWIFKIASPDDPTANPGMTRTENKLQVAVGSDALEVRCAACAPGRVELLDTQGRLLCTTHGLNGQARIPAQGLPAGGYLVRWHDAQARRSVRVLLPR